ncbi:MAG: hypothetical protein WC858_05005 [Parcubacteria group bacterium]|jgi:hypothetical protein
MKINNKNSGGMNAKKIKILSVIVVSLAMFLATFFAMAENKNGSTIFLDNDQDGLADQEERSLGTNPNNPDTDGDGYSDGKEVNSGYNPLKPAPGDRIFTVVPSASGQESTGSANPAPASESQAGASQLSSLSLESLTSSGDTGTLLSNDVLQNLTSDPENPNLTNEMIGSLMQLTKTKAESSSDFSANPTFSADDFTQVAENSLSSANVVKDLPEIKDDEIKVLPEIKDKDLTDAEIKEKQKQEIQAYLASVAFIMANNSPFPIETTSSLQTNLTQESGNLLAALSSGDKTKIDDYAQKARAGIDQIKKVEVPYVMKDIHKSILQLAIYTLSLKDSAVVDTNDPMKSLAAMSSLQSVAESALKIQSEMTNILNAYGIDAVELK